MVDRLKKIKGKLGLIDESPGLQPPAISKAADKQSEGLSRLSNVFARFHRVAQTLRHRHSSRETLIIKDEYDVQDLLHSLLHLHFSDIRSEDYSPSYAGGNSRVDFVLKDEKIIVEVKMTNNSLKDKEVGSQLLIDIGRYRGHPDCRVLVVFVYDKEDYIRNKRGMITDWSV
jgi:very-short-patch-repair endonuclease